MRLILKFLWITFQPMSRVEVFAAAWVAHRWSLALCLGEHNIQKIIGRRDWRNRLNASRGHGSFQGQSQVRVNTVERAMD